MSVDSHFSHKAWLNTPRNKGGIEGCKYPVAADFTKKTATDYGVLQETLGVAHRGLFIIDDKGVIQVVEINNLPVGRNVDEVLRLIDAFQTHYEIGAVCPIGWKKGDEPIDPNTAPAWFEKNG